MYAFIRAILLGLASIGMSSLVQAGEPNGTFTLQVENDRFADTDRHYTHGTRLSYLTGAEDNPDWSAPLFDAVPLFAPQGKRRLGVTLGQSIFTPEDISQSQLIESDRPYAGWLYGGLVLSVETPTRLDSIELDVGVVGPGSLAEEVQTAVHETFGFTRPEGWANQLGNEPGVVLYAERRWRKLAEFRTLGLQAEIIPHLGGSLGNVFTYGAGGAVLRIGQDLPADFGIPRIRPSLPGSAFFAPTDAFGWYLFAGAEGRAIARNIFLDGNSFQDSHEVEKKTFVGDFQIGVAFHFGRVRLAYTHVFQTREFEGQRHGDRFGAVTVSVNF